MANTPPQDDRFYKQEVLLKWFGISSIVMLVFTVWMILDDFGREWKGYQLEFASLKTKKIEEGLKAAEQTVDKNKLEELQKGMQASVQTLATKDKDIEKLRKEIDQLKTKEKITTNRYQGAKIEWDVEKYHYEAHYGHKIAEGHPENNPKAHKSYEKLMKNWDNVVKLRDIANGVTQAKQDKERDLASIFAEKNKLEKELKIARAELDRLQLAKEGSEMTLHKLMRNAPILDLASPVLKVNQIVVPSIKDDIYFARIGKVDRCTTCHLAIDLPGFENEKQPYRTHPRLDVMLGSRSPHPIDTIGCTVCHEGRGQSVDFVRSAHTPRNEEQKKEWVKKYGWHEMHHVIEKMLPLQYTEGKCRTCHRQTEYVPKAEKNTSGVQMIKAAGCFGCHKITGWEHVRKPAPSLKRIKGKVSRDWMVKWIRSPKGFNEFARMPASFHQSNITTEEFKKYNEAEIHAVADYLLAESEDYFPNVRMALGNAARGKEVVGSVGCLGCHGIDDFARRRYGMAPDLSTVGSKVSKDWLVTWLKNPKHYWEGTTMPSLRLSGSETADVAAYLMSKRNPEFESAPAGTPDLEEQKKVLRLYLMRDPKLAPNTNEKIDKVIAELKAHEITMQLGKNVLNRYGCFSCHEVKGFETTASIAPELSEIGSKPLNKFDFGLMHIEHSNYGWMRVKLKDPRIFDRGIVKEYLDLLKMPNFQFEEPEIERLITPLLGYTSQKVDAPSEKILSAKEAKFEQGMRLIHQYNCQGCHTVEYLHQQLPEGHPGMEDHEKTKFDLEGRILAYYSEDESLGPPPIHGEGLKVFTSWAYDFINGPFPLRTRLKIRMPTFQFDNQQLNTLVTAWGNEGNVEFPFSRPERPKLDGARLAAAKTLFTKLQCLNCHADPTGGADDGSRGLAPNFRHTAKRLRREWIIDWLKDPNKMQPGTRMPGFWPDGNSPAPEVLGGNSQAQIEAVADYIISIGAGTPPAE